jgi:hypothetical protein
VAKKNHDDEYDERLDAMQERIDARFPEGLVQFSAYNYDDDELPVDNLDDIAIEGTCILIQDHDSFWGEGKDYKSLILNSPTWWDVLKHANDMVAVTGDQHHVFLEGVEETGDKIDGVPCYEFLMGS